MINTNQQQEKPQDFELMELLFEKVDSSTSNAADQLDKSFEARFQSLVDQIQSYLHSSEKAGFFPHRFLGWFSSVLYQFPLYKQRIDNNGKKAILK